MNPLHVRITPDVAQKYVLVSVKDAEGQEQVCLWGSPTAEWHKDIVLEMEASGWAPLNVEGGGRICYLPAAQTLYVWDKSTRYGEAPLERVLEILGEAFPGHELRTHEPE